MRVAVDLRGRGSWLPAVIFVIGMMLIGATAHRLLLRPLGQAPALLELEPSSIQVNRKLAEPLQVHRVSISNPTNKTATLLGVQSVCGVSIDDRFPQSIGPHESSTFDITVSAESFGNCGTFIRFISDSRISNDGIVQFHLRDD
jgi:hypothetical protein